MFQLAGQFLKSYKNLKVYRTPGPKIPRGYFSVPTIPNKNRRPSSHIKILVLYALISKAWNA